MFSVDGIFLGVRESGAFCTDLRQFYPDPPASAAGGARGSLTNARTVAPLRSRCMRAVPAAVLREPDRTNEWLVVWLVGCSACDVYVGAGA